MNVKTWLQPAGITFSCIDRHLLHPEDLFHTKADAGTVATALAGTLFLSRLCEIVAIFLAQGASDLAVLPKIALAAACRSVLMVAYPVD